MALTSLINSFKTLVLSNVKNISALATVSDVRKPPLLDVLQSKCNVSKGVVFQCLRFVGTQNPVKYKKGIRSHCYRRWVDKPEEYTTKHLKCHKLGGRDPVTGRVVVKTIGGGHKQNYRWVLFTRRVEPGAPLVEKVHSIHYDPQRTARIALVASGTQKRWLLATENMKAGDLIKSSCEIPRNPVKPCEGDAWPLGALPIGTKVHCVEPFPGGRGYFARAAGTSCDILRKVEGRVIIRVPSKHEISLKEECMAVVGRVSNIDHNKKPIGSAQRNRWLGNRPRSGLWHRKDGYCGRKIRPLPPLKVHTGVKQIKQPIYKLTL